jgi:hypothetical protein
MRRLLLAFPAALLLAGCGLLYAEIEIPRASITLIQESFPPTPPLTALTRQLDYDLGANISQLNDKDVTFEIRLDEMEIADSAVQPTAAVPDLSNIDSVEIEVIAPAGSGLVDRPVVTYTRPPGTVGPLTSVTASGHANVDLGPYVRAGKLSLRATASGALPAFDWNADITGRFYLKLRFDYGKKIPL